MIYKTRTNAEKKQKFRKEKNSNSQKKWKAIRDRHAKRRSFLGRQTEDRVALLLEKKQKQGELVSFVKHQTNSPEDRAGKDFTISMLIGEKVITTSFGVTISPSQPEMGIPLIRIPPEMGDERIWYRICRICEEKANNN